jgi:acyl-CoA reductase-like NAD-dependent aldehyde dehydrogenase
VIFEDIDPKRAAAGAAFAAFVAAGQTCIQGARLLVHDHLYDEVVEDLTDRAQTLRLGDPMDESTQLGPLVSAEQRQRVETAVENAKQQGATVLTGGARPAQASLQSGYYYEPTLITNVSDGMDVWRDEIFGPVTVIRSFRSEREAVALANDSPYGLGASVWTGQIGRAHRVAGAIEAGVVWVNDHHRIDPASPWGGTKDSGIGRENGIDGYRAYTQTRSVIVNLSDEPFDWFGSDQVVRYS